MGSRSLLFPAARGDALSQHERRGSCIKTGNLLSESLTLGQLIEQYLGLCQIGGVEAFGEPVVDVDER